jgi:hypothetical protein
MVQKQPYDVVAGRNEKQRLLVGAAAGGAAGAGGAGAGASVVAKLARQNDAAAAGDVIESGGGGVRGRALAAVLVGCACVLGVVAVGARGGGFGGGSPIFTGAARLGLGDAGYGRELTPEEQSWKDKIEREAAEATVKAVEALTGDTTTHDDAAGTFTSSNLGGAVNLVGAGVVRDANGFLINNPVVVETSVGGHNLTHVAARLGRWGGCPGAFVQPKAAPRADWTASYVVRLYT